MLRNAHPLYLKVLLVLIGLLAALLFMANSGRM